MGNIIPIMPVAIDRSIRRVVATKPIARSASTPIALRPRRAAEAKPPHNNGQCAGDATDDADHRAVGPHEWQEVACHQHQRSDRDSWPEPESQDRRWWTANQVCWSCWPWL